MPFFNHWYILVLILIIVLIVYGPGKLPEVGGAIGKAMREFRKATSELSNDVSSAVNPPPAAPPDTAAKSTESTSSSKN